MEAYGFKDRSTAERLRDFAGELGNQPWNMMKAPRQVNATGQHRSYWIVPKGVIPPATNPTTPGIGKAFICKIDREADPPVLIRHQFAGADVEIDVFNYTATQVIEKGELEPLLRIYEDVFGDLAIVDDGRVKYAQAPVGGIPKRTGKVPGSATCTAIVRATIAGTGYVAGDLVKTPFTFTVLNWDGERVQANVGDRLIQVSGHYVNADLVGVVCTNTGSASVFPLIDEPPAPPPPP
jgi:hypothetical protein